MINGSTNLALTSISWLLLNLDGPLNNGNGGEQAQSAKDTHQCQFQPKEGFVTVKIPSLSIG